MHWLTRRRPPAVAQAASGPDPALPPGRRGTWQEAALTNVRITEVVKREIGTSTSPQQR